MCQEKNRTSTLSFHIVELRRQVFELSSGERD